MFLTRVCQAFKKSKIGYALVGGHAVALHGVLRGTVDVDFIIKWNRKTLIKAEEVLKSLGLESRLPIRAEEVFDYRDEYIQNKNLIAWNFYNPDDLTEQVDLIINQDLNDYKFKDLKIDGGEISILSLDSLIEMKEQTSREQDKADVVALKRIRDEK